MKMIVWVYDDAKVYDKANILLDSKVYDKAEVYDHAWLQGFDSYVKDNAKVYGAAGIQDDEKVYGNAELYSNAKVDYNVSGDTKVNK